jgi:hypothetical protein
VATTGEVTIERNGKTFAATYETEGDMVHVKTHTETRSVECRGIAPEVVARRVLDEIVDADRPR